MRKSPLHSLIRFISGSGNATWFINSYWDLSTKQNLGRFSKSMESCPKYFCFSHYLPFACVFAPDSDFTPVFLQ